MSDTSFKSTGGKNVTNPDLFSLEKQVMNDINNFNIVYSYYVRCAGKPNQYANTDSCPYTDATMLGPAVKGFKEILDRSIKALDDAIQNNSTTGIKRDDYTHCELDIMTESEKEKMFK
jgi:hypothetical protein